MARSTISDIVRLLADGNHPPLHYFVLRGWWLLVGDGEFVLRFSSVLFGLLWVALAYRLGLIVGDRKTALMGALLLAISRFAIVWSQQIRMYTWSTMCTTLAIVTAVLFWRKRRWQSLLLYVFAAAAGLLSLYLTVSVMITINLVFLGVWIFLGKPGRLFFRWIGAQLAVVILVMPWLLLNASQAETWTIFEPISLVEYVRLYASMLVLGNPLDISATLPLTLVAVAVFLCGSVIVYIRERRLWQRVGFSVLWLGLLVQAVVVYAVCFGIVPGFARPLVPRYLLLLSTGFYVIAGWGLAEAAAVPWLNNRRGLVLAASGLFIVPQLIGLSTLYPGRVRRDDYISIANALGYMRYPQDALILYVDRDWPVFEAHYSGERYNAPYGMDINENSVDALLSSWWHKHDAVWVVTTPEALQSDPNQHIPVWLEEHAIHSEIVISGEIKLTLYIKNPERQVMVYSIPTGVIPVDTLPQSQDLLNVDIPLRKYRTGDTIYLALTWAEYSPAGYSVEISGEGIQKRQDVEQLYLQQDAGSLYQIVDFNLDPGMPGGKYTAFVLDDTDSVVAEIQFELIHAAAGLDIALDQVPNPVSYTLGQSIHLVGYTLAETKVKAGQYIELTLYWRTDSPIPSRYKVFTHVLGTNFNANSGNFLWGQVDSEPARGQALTTLWTPHSVIVDPYKIAIDPQAPPGEYIIEVGMYGLVDIARLPVFSQQGQVIDDAIQLVAIEVTSP